MVAVQLGQQKENFQVTVFLFCYALCCSTICNVMVFHHVLWFSVIDVNDEKTLRLRRIVLPLEISYCGRKRSCPSAFLCSFLVFFVCHSSTIFFSVSLFLFLFFPFNSFFVPLCLAMLFSCSFFFTLVSFLPQFLYLSLSLVCPSLVSLSLFLCSSVVCHSLCFSSSSSSFSLFYITVLSFLLY